MRLKELAAERGLQVSFASNAQLLAVKLAECVAEALREAIRQRGLARMALSGGRSPEAFLRCLDGQAVEWQQVSITLVDERWVATHDIASNAGMLHRCMPRALGKAAWLPLFRGESPARDACATEKDLACWLPLDVVMLGMGADGHCASLFASQDNLESLLDSDGGPLCAAVRAADGSPRITLTAAALRSARLQVLAISGDDKYQTVCEAFQASPGLMPVAAFLAAPLHIFYSDDQAGRNG